jgi:hypothetical protein
VETPPARPWSATVVIPVPNDGVKIAADGSVRFAASVPVAAVVETDDDGSVVVRMPA